MAHLTEVQTQLLEDEIYSTLMAVKMYDAEGNEVEMDMGDMGDCHDEAQRIVREWAEKAGITIDN